MQNNAKCKEKRSGEKRREEREKTHGRSKKSVTKKGNS